MFCLLVKKQLFEIFRSWFFNAKKNEARSKIGTVCMALLFTALIVGLLGGLSVSVSVYLCKPLFDAGLSWMYFDLFALASVAFGLFGSVFNTYAGLYLAKDNDLLLSMPIPVRTIVSARLSGTYLMGTLYSAVLFLPSVIVYQAVSGFDFPALLGGFFIMIENSLLVFVLSCLLGFAVAKISLKLKNRSFVSVLASVVFIGLYYFVYFRAQQFLSDLLANVARYGEEIKSHAYFLYFWGQNGTGSVLEIAVCLLICALLVVGTWLLLKNTFLKIAIATPEGKKISVKAEKQTKQSPSRALLAKEIRRFTSSSIYMLNCGFGVLLIPVAGIAMLIKGQGISQALAQETGMIIDILPVLAVGITCMIATMNDTAAPSVSLEGKSLWILQSLPVDSWQIIKAKIKLQIFLTAIPMAFLCVCILIAFPFTLAEQILYVIITMLFTVLSSLFCMFLGLKMPVFQWTNEIVPIKQSGCVMFAIFGGWGYAALLIVGYIGLRLFLSPAWYLAAFAVLTAALIVLLYRYLKNKGTRLFDAL